MKKRLAHHLANALTWLLVLSVVFPLLWLVSTSFKNKIDAFAIPPKLLAIPTIENYRVMLTNDVFLRSFKNSVLITSITVVIALFLGVTAGYGLARSASKVSRHMGMWIILARMIPPMGVIIPFYIVFSRLRMLDTLFSLTLIYLTTILPFVVWIMMGFFRNVPIELEEAGMIDGCTRIGTLFRIVVPLSKPGIATAAMFSFIMSWNEYFYAVIMTGNSRITATVAIRSLINSTGVVWGELSAGSIIVLLPVLLFTLLGQKNLVHGLMSGAVKG